MRRTSWRVPGFDCKWAPCTHEHKGDHGISGGRLGFAVTTDEGDLAVSTSAEGGDYPGTIPETHRAACVESAARCVREGSAFHGLFIHAAFPMEQEQLLSKPTTDCRLLPVCYDGSGSYLLGDKLLSPFAARDGWGLIAAAQPEPFWLALEGYLRREAPALRQARADALWYVCPACHGDRFLPRLQAVRIEPEAPGETPGSPPSGPVKSTK